MTTYDWDPRDPAVLDHPLESYDAMRQKCPVAHSKSLGYTVFRHADVKAIINDHKTYSNNVSRHLSVPNSMDPPEHTPYRQAIEPYFNAERMAEFKPICQQLCHDLVAKLPVNQNIEIMASLAYPFAAAVQCAFLGWDKKYQQPLLDWIHKKNAASLTGDQQRNKAIALEFDQTIRSILDERRQTPSLLSGNDATARLMREHVHGRLLSDDEIVSILRNWTVGELGTIAASVGIIAQFLALNPDIQQQLRDRSELVYAATDEILRIEAPLIPNRRTPTCPVHLHGKDIAAGERITVLWASANRDETVFPEPTQFRFDRNPEDNLLYGAGVHVCPGAPLARLELEAITLALLNATHSILPVRDAEPIAAVYPVGGYRRAFAFLQQY